MKPSIYISSVILAFWMLIMPSPISGQVIVEPGSFISVAAGGQLFIDTSFTILTDDTMSGHLCDRNPAGEIDITGSVIVERYLSADEWHNCASPVANNQSTVYTGTDLIFYYDETIIQNDWEFGWVMYEGMLSAMKGYDVYLFSPATVSYTAPSSAGLNTGNYSINVTRTDPPIGEIENRKGWNLIGNPYPSPVDWLRDQGWDKSTINDAKYIWDPVNQSYSIFLGGKDPIDVNNGTRYIPANQGFWVQALHNGSVKINNLCRVGQMENTPGFYKNTGFDYPILCLRVEVDGFYDETIIRFIDGATAGFDINQDACSFLGRSGNSPQISSACGRDYLDINTLPFIGESMEIPLNFKYSGNSICTLSILEKSNLCDFAEVYILDQHSNTLIDLSTKPEYSFPTNSGVESTGFMLYINPSEDIKNQITNDNAFSIFSFDKTICIVKNTARDMATELSVFDIYGNLMERCQIPVCNEYFHATTCPKGYYIARITSNDISISKKILIN
jgi:hypothetical protein